MTSIILFVVQRFVALMQLIRTKNSIKYNLYNLHPHIKLFFSFYKFITSSTPTLILFKWYNISSSYKKCTTRSNLISLSLFAVIFQEVWIPPKQLRSLQTYERLLQRGRKTFRAGSEGLSGYDGITCHRWDLKTE